MKHTTFRSSICDTDARCPHCPRKLGCSRPANHPPTKSASSKSHGGVEVNRLLWTVVRCTSLILVRRVTSSATPVAAAITSSRGEASASPVEASAAAEPTAAAAATHPGDVGSLRRHLDVAPFEDALVEHQRLRHQAGLLELNIGVAKVVVGQQTEVLGPLRRGVRTNPLGCPVNLSRSMVTRLMEPQL